MDIQNIVMWIAVGALVGYYATENIRINWQQKQDLFMDITVGIGGGLLGGVVLNLIHVGGAVGGLNVGSIVTAFVGAILLVVMLRVTQMA